MCVHHESMATRESVRRQIDPDTSVRIAAELHTPAKRACATSDNGHATLNQAPCPEIKRCFAPPSITIVEVCLLSGRLWTSPAPPKECRQGCQRPVPTSSLGTQAVHESNTNTRMRRSPRLPSCRTSSSLPRFTHARNDGRIRVFVFDSWTARTPNDAAGATRTSPLTTFAYTPPKRTFDICSFSRYARRHKALMEPSIRPRRSTESRRCCEYGL